MGMAIRLPFAVALTGPKDRHPKAPPRSSERVAKDFSSGGPAGRDCETRGTAHPPALLRHAFAGSRDRHPHRAGTPRPQARTDNDDLYARPEPARNLG